MNVGTVTAPCATHHRPSIIEARPSLLEIPAPVHQSTLNLDSNPLKKIGKLRLL